MGAMVLYYVDYIAPELNNIKRMCLSVVDYIRYLYMTFIM